MVPHLIIYEFNIGVQFRKEKKNQKSKNTCIPYWLSPPPIPLSLQGESTLWQY